MSEHNKENILKLADFIEREMIPFKMSVWNDKGIKPLCETACCIGGSGIVLMSMEKEQNFDLEKTTFGELESSQDRVANWLGLDLIESNILFLPRGWDWTSSKKMYPKEKAVKVLRNLAETGKVDWKNA